MVGWVVAAFALAAWLWLLLFRGSFWRTDQRLPRLVEPERWPSVAVVVPARDEAVMLRATLPTLLCQRYQGDVLVIVVDDGSTDGTAEAARRIAAEVPGLPFTVLTSGGPPPGWAGKPSALARGVAEAGQVDYLLFTDADVAHAPRSLATLVAAASGGRELVSQMARLRTETVWERLVVPAFVYFFAMLYPFRRVNTASASTAAAAGGCVLVRRDVLVRAGGLDAIRGAVIDDVALARLVQRAGGRLWLGLATDVRSLRAYPRLGDLWQMIARSAYTQLRYSPALLGVAVVGLLLVFFLPPVATVAAAATGDLPALLLGAAAWVVMTATFVPMLRYYRLPVLAALLLPVVAALYVSMTVDSARRHRFGTGATWKGRSYAVPDRR